MSTLFKTRSSGHYVPFLLAPVEGWGPCGPCWGPSAPSRVAISKLWTLNFKKLEICVTLIAILHYIEAKFDYGYFMIFFALWFLNFTKKISSPFKQKWRRDIDFPDSKWNQNSEKSPSRLHFWLKWLDFLCRILELLRKINYKIAIVKFCL